MATIQGGLSSLEATATGNINGTTQSVGQPSLDSIDTKIIGLSDTISPTPVSGMTATPASASTQAGHTPQSSKSDKPADKPRPHVCGTCSRSFARLEHLKRHERSHTKEKPFECPQCARCFARRDLLLRHQQKLHQAGTTSTKVRNGGGRRDSISGPAPATSLSRVRKNSIAGAALTTGRTAQAFDAMGIHSQQFPPLPHHAHSQSVHHHPPHPLHPTHHQHQTQHLTDPHHQQLAPAHSHHHQPGQGQQPQGFHAYHNSVDTFDFTAFSSAFIPLAGELINSGHGNGVENTPMYQSGMDAGLQNTPLMNVANETDMDKLFGSSTTINPAQLHFVPSQTSPQENNYQTAMSDMDDLAASSAFDWAFPELPLANNMATNSTGPLQSMMGTNPENAIEESSPSVLSSASQNGGGFREVMLDGSNAINPTAQVWASQGQPQLPTTMDPQAAYSTMDSTLFPELTETTGMGMNGMVSAAMSIPAQEAGSVPVAGTGQEMAPPSISTIHDLFGQTGLPLSSPGLFSLPEDGLNS